MPPEKTGKTWSWWAGSARTSAIGGRPIPELVAGGQLLKGAAVNAVQIAELL